MRPSHPPRRRTRSSAAHAFALAMLLVAGLLSGAPVAAFAAPVPVDDVTPKSPQGDGSELDPIRFDIAVDCVAARSGDTEVVLDGDAKTGDWYEIGLTRKAGTDDCFAELVREDLCRTLACTPREFHTGPFPPSPLAVDVKFEFKPEASGPPRTLNPSAAIRVVFAPSSSFLDSEAITGTVEFVIKTSSSGGGVVEASDSFTVNPGNPTSGDGLTSSTPFVHEVALDCTQLKSVASDFVHPLLLDGVFGRWYEIVVNTSNSFDCSPTGSFTLADGTMGPVSASSGVYRKSFQLQDVGAGRSLVDIGASGRVATFFIQGRSLVGRPSPSSSAPDPRAATVGIAAEQVAAAGVEGSASGVRVRGTEVLPVTSRLSGAVGPRGGVVLSSGGLEVRVASVLGARVDAGVLVPSNGVFEASVTGALVPGSVVEVWINSTPRLVAAAEVPEDGATTIVIPTGTPLDGGEPIEDGAHTLELRMFTADGFEVVATGITVGSPVPASVPAGEGGLPLGAGLLVLLGAAGAVLVAGRRLVTAC